MNIPKNMNRLAGGLIAVLVNDPVGSGCVLNRSPNVCSKPNTFDTDT